MYECVYRTVIARGDAERAHHLTVAAMAAAGRAPGGVAALGAFAPPADDRLRQRLWGLPFANPLGVAAGLDKDGQAVIALHALGFGHVEVGTVTLRPQPGNPKPRVWRAVDERALVNAMGFPSDGAAAVRARLIGLRPAGVVGINIGKNRDTPIEQAVEDYAALVAALFDIANYVAVNVSSPNTPGLRSLQTAGELLRILDAVNGANTEAAALAGLRPRPVLVKIAPDLTDTEVEAVAEAALEGGASGIIATNTTTSRAGLPDRFGELPGGTSGKPLRERANAVCRLLYRRLDGRLPIVGVGGISCGADAVVRVRAGASLIQVYTGFTYAGPRFAESLLGALSADADARGWHDIGAVVGSDA